MPIVKCQTCAKDFYTKPSYQIKGGGKYCSRNCSHESMKTGHFLNCFTCGKQIWRTQKNFRKSKSGKFFCQKSCQTKWRNQQYVGKNHSSWKNGESTYRTVLLKSKIKAACRVCSTTDDRILAVHHLDKDRKNYKLENLIWLCHNCHHLVHHHGVKIK